MEKEFYKSKGIWGGILIIIGTGLKVLAQEGAVEIEDVTMFGIGLGLIGIRDALKA